MFTVGGLECEVEGLRFSLWFKISDFRVQGSGFKVQGL